MNEVETFKRLQNKLFSIFCLPVSIVMIIFKQAVTMTFKRRYAMVSSRSIVVITAVLLMTVFSISQVHADRRSADLLRSGLLGAGAGAVGGAASGARSRDLWKGALAGAGVNIIGGAVLDSMSGEKVQDVQKIDQSDPRTAFSDGYEAGYANAYKQGYMDGFKDGLREAYSTE